MKKLLNHIALTTVLLMSGCGYISDKPVENAGLYKSEELQTCQIDVSKLSEIFTTDQKEQIKCLEENFIQFTKYVRAQKPGAITESEMGIFVKKFFAGQSETIIKSLSLIFQLNMILLKDEADRISHSKITPLFELLVKVNQEAVIITNIIKKLDDPKNQKQFWELRQKFIESLMRFSTSAIGVIEKTPGIPQKLNLKTFALDVTKKIGHANVDEESIDSFLFLKRILIAGDRELITTDEIKGVIKKMPDVLGLLFDVYYVKSENFPSENDEMKFYTDATRNIFSIIEFNQPDFVLITSEQLVKIAEGQVSDRDVRKFKPSLEALKARFIGGKKDVITLTDLKVILNILLDYNERLFFNNLTYDNYRQTLESQGSILMLPPLSLPGYSDFSAKRLKELHSSFNDIAFNFRYFREKKSGAAYYSTRIARNKSGFIEVAMSKWLATKIVNAYGHKDTYFVQQVSMEELQTLLLEAKTLLEEFKLWSPNFATFARNSLLLADLFQQQSNGDMNIGVNEASEYIGMILSSVEISGRLIDEVKFVCDSGTKDHEPQFNLNCFNRHYFDILLNKLEYKKSFPRLQAYIQNSSPEESLGYLRGVEGFARDNDLPGVPVNRRDATLVLGAMINIESTFIRFDENVDNIIDYKELNRAFLVYRSSIIALAKLDKNSEKYALAIFLYMASKMEIPKTGYWFDDMKFATFAKCVTSDFCRDTFMDKIEAKRLNIGKLLYYLVNQNANALNQVNRNPQR